MNQALQWQLDFVTLPRMRGNGMKKKKSKDQGDLIVVNGGGAQHTRSGGDMDRVHRRVMLWR